MATVAVSNFGPEFDAAMKAMREAPPVEAQMRTWYCSECSAHAKKPVVHVDKGRPGCSTCPHYEIRVGVS
jgi:hypothetical protein